LRCEISVPHGGHLTICSKLHGKRERAENVQRLKSRLPFGLILQGGFERKNWPKPMIPPRHAQTNVCENL
jgi:hypothetical protein